MNLLLAGLYMLSAYGIEAVGNDVQTRQRKMQAFALQDAKVKAEFDATMARTDEIRRSVQASQDRHYEDEAIRADLARFKPGPVRLKPVRPLVPLREPKKP